MRNIALSTCRDVVPSDNIGDGENLTRPSLTCLADGPEMAGPARRRQAVESVAHPVGIPPADRELRRGHGPGGAQLNRQREREVRERPDQLLRRTERSGQRQRPGTGAGSRRREREPRRGQRSSKRWQEWSPRPSSRGSRWGWESILDSGGGSCRSSISGSGGGAGGGGSSRRITIDCSREISTVTISGGKLDRGRTCCRRSRGSCSASRGATASPTCISAVIICIWVCSSGSSANSISQAGRAICK